MSDTTMPPEAHNPRTNQPYYALGLLPLRTVGLSLTMIMTIILAISSSVSIDRAATARSSQAISPATEHEVLSFPVGGRSRVEPLSEIAAKPAWVQDFTNQTKLDTNVWRHDLDPSTPTFTDNADTRQYDGELQAYTASPQNVRVEQGTGLIIEAHRQEHVYPNDSTRRQWNYTSGRIETMRGHTVGLGRVEATMKLPEGMGVWPAFWMLSLDGTYSSKTDSPGIDWGTEYLRSGELDIMEYYGHQPGIIDMTAHAYNRTNAGTTGVSDATTAFHTYAVDILKDRLVWRIDGKEIRTFHKPSDNPNDWPFTAQNQQKVILNLAMGGPAGTPDAGRDSWQFVVKDLKYFPLVD